MSDFMKSIVEEVMKPNQKPKENPIFSSKQPNQEVRASVKSNDLQGVKRPNYQRNNIQKRLAVLTEDTSSKPVYPNMVQKNVSKNTSSSFSQLKTLSLAQGNKKENDNRHNTFGKNGNSEVSQLIGHSKDGVKAWLFNGIHPNLNESFHRNLKSNYIGVITSEQCTVGQLFMLNEVMKEYDTNKYYVIWDKENKRSFVLELYEDNCEKLLMVVKTLYQKMSQKPYKSIQSYKALNPSSWLTKRLALNSYVNSVGVLDGVDYYTSVLLLDRYLKKSTEQTDFGYLIEKNYLLLYGHDDNVTKILEVVEKEAGRLR